MNRLAQDSGIAASGTTIHPIESILPFQDTGIFGPVVPLVTALEGAALTTTVLTFTDADPANSAADFSGTTIDWGDGTATSPGTVTGSNGAYSVAGTHTYNEDGTFGITITVRGGPGEASLVGSNEAMVADAPLTADPPPSTLLATAGTAASNVPLGTFSDADPTGTASDYTVTIDWGDGTYADTTSGRVSGSGTFNVTGTHTYQDGGFFTVSTQIVDQGGATTTVLSQASVTDLPLAPGSVNVISAAEGSATTLAATFSDANPNEPASAYTAAIDWGDNNSDVATVTGASGTWSVSGSHTYLDSGTYSVSLQVIDGDGGTLTETGSATVADAPLSATSVPLFATAGVLASNVAVATFSDANPDEPASSYGVVISWGDNSANTAGTISASSGGFNVAGSHQYASSGIYSVGVTIRDDGGSSATATSTANVTTMVARGAAVSAAEGVLASGATIATFTDPQNYPPGSYPISINWGDGSSPDTTTGQVTGSAGSFTVTGSHTYAQGGSFPVTVTISNPTGGATLANGTATVSDPALRANGATVTGSQGVLLTNVAVATFTDAGPLDPPETYQALVDWGDGSTPDFGWGTQAGSLFTVNSNHLYFSSGTFAVHVTITDAGGSTVAATSSAAIGPAALSAVGVNATATEGAAANVLVARFTDTNTTYVATSFTTSISWGDGSPDDATGTVTGSAGSFQLTGTHTYADAGSYAVVVTITDPAAHTSVASSTATVADAALAGAAVPFSPIEGQGFSGNVATFSDANAGDSAYVAVIDWGNGAVTRGTISSLSGGNYGVSGAITYFEEGSFAVRVTITDSDGDGSATIVVANAVTVADAPLSSRGQTLAATQYISLQSATVAFFADGNPSEPASVYSATIDWGDGATTPNAVVSGTNGAFSVAGSHAYATNTIFNYRVTISDPGGAATTATGRVYVGGPPLPFLVATFTDSDTTHPPSAYQAVIDWGDGSSPTNGPVFGGDGSFQVSSRYVYAEDGVFPVTVTITGPDGSTAVAQGTAQVADAPMKAASLIAAAADPTVQVQKVGFLGDEKTITSDDGKISYSMPTWKSTQSKQDPLAYVRNTQIAVTADFQVSDPTPFKGVDVTIKGTITGTGIPRGMVIQATVRGDGTNKLAITGQQGVAANIPFDRVTTTDMVISWEIMMPNGKKLPAGTTKNRLYVLYAVPIQTGRPLFETVVQTGSIYNGGAADTQQTAFDNIWKKFESLRILRANYLPTDRNPFLKYYGSYRIIHSDQTSNLVGSGDGDCIAWAHFFIDVLEAQGRHDNDWFYAVAPPSPSRTNPNIINWGILVKQWNFTTDPPLISIPAGANTPFAGNRFYLNIWPGPSTGENSIPYIEDTDYTWGLAQVQQVQNSRETIKGQGQPNPASLFKGHNLVKVGDRFYDPSYGTTNKFDTDISEFREKAVAGFYVYYLLNLDANNHFDPNGTPTNVFMIIKKDHPLAPKLQRVSTGDDNY